MANNTSDDNNIFNAQHYLTSMTPLSGIDIKKSWQPIICSHLQSAAKMADIINAAPLDPNTIDLANTFSPGR